MFIHLKASPPFKKENLFSPFIIVITTFGDERAGLFSSSFVKDRLQLVIVALPGLLY